MTRREWLKQNPPPRSAGHTRELLVDVQAQDVVRKQLEANKQAYNSQHVPYWNEAIVAARAAGNTSALNYADGELKKVQQQLAEIDRGLAALANVPSRIQTLTAEIALGAKCPIHNVDLVRHKNRPEDLFVCETGPHYLLWTKNGAAGVFAPVDITKTIPGLDFPVLDGLKISRADWLASHWPQVLHCPQHKEKPLVLSAKANRPDIFSCAEDHAQFLWTIVNGTAGFAPLLGVPPALDAEMEKDGWL